jgi:multiple sugar transport system permease protein
MIIPAQVTMLPLFLMLKNMGLINTYLAVIIPGMASIFGIFLIRQYLLSIPDSIIEAAKIEELRLNLFCLFFTQTNNNYACYLLLWDVNDFLQAVSDDGYPCTLPVALANLMVSILDTELMMAGSL